jgi:DNA-binding transcriptional LysR family regulator
LNVMKRELGLLVVFDAVAQSGSVTAAARQLALSQPAVSHALNRLRDLTGDQLFARSGRGLVATARAHALMVPVRELLAEADRLLHAGPFDPARDVRRMRVAASEYAMLTIVPALLRETSRSAPHVMIEVQPVGPETLLHLERGIVDVSFWGTTLPKAQFQQMTLFRENFVGVARSRHPVFGQTSRRVSLRQYLAHPHAVVSLGDPGRNVIDEVLASKGHARRIAAATPSFMANLAALSGSDLIATVPSRLCRGPHMRGLATFALPMAVDAYDYCLIWHQRSTGDAALAWLRARIAALA